MTAGNDLLTIFHTVRSETRSGLPPCAARCPSRSLAIVPQRRPVVREWTPAIDAGIRRHRLPSVSASSTRSARRPAGTIPSIPKLWLYNLHYFEAPEAGLMCRWVAENPPGHGQWLGAVPALPPHRQLDQVDALRGGSTPHAWPASPFRPGASRVRSNTTSSPITSSPTPRPWSSPASSSQAEPLAAPRDRNPGTADPPSRCSPTAATSSAARCTTA